MAKQTKWLAGLLLCTVLLTSCGNAKVINKIMLVQTLGIDLENNDIKGTVLIGDFKKKNESNTLLLDTKTVSEFAVLPGLNTKTKKEIAYGQLGTIVFGHSYAVKGIDAFMENLCRETRISNLLQLAVTDLEAQEILKTAQASKESYILTDMIEQNIANGNLPSINLHRALYSYYSNKQSLFLPHLTLNDKELDIDGLALFRRGKLISTLDLEKSLYLKLLLENAKNGSLSVPNPNKESSSKRLQLEIISSKVRFKVDKQTASPSIQYRLSIHTRVNGFPDQFTIREKAYKAKLEHHIGSYCEEEINHMLEDLRKDRLDPLGLANIVTHRPSGSELRNEKEEDRAVKAAVKVNVQIVQTPVEPE